MYKLFLEQLNYRNRDPDHVDSRLLWMGIKNHLRDPQNFKRMMNRTTPHLWADEIKDLDPKIQQKHPNLRISFMHKYDTAPEATGGYIKHKTGEHSIYLLKFNSLHPNMLQNNHFYDSHKSFMGELNKKFIDFTHEYKHYTDEETKRIRFGDSYVDYQGGPKAYYNNPREVSAHIHEKQYEIERELLQNNYHPKTDDTVDKTYFTHLPLRKRLYQYRDNDFLHHLEIISTHTGNNTHHQWYNSLTPENQQKAKNALQPIVNKYMIANPGHE